MSILIIILIIQISNLLTIYKTFDQEKIKFLKNIFCLWDNDYSICCEKKCVNATKEGEEVTHNDCQACLKDKEKNLFVFLKQQIIFVLDYYQQFEVVQANCLTNVLKIVNSTLQNIKMFFGMLQNQNVQMEIYVQIQIRLTLLIALLLQEIYNQF